MNRNISALSVAFSLVAAFMLLLFCTDPLNPDLLDQNARVSLDVAGPVFIEEDFPVGISLHLPALIDSVILDFGDGSHDTIRTAGKDTLFNTSHFYTEEGDMVITATAFTSTLSKQATCRITVVSAARLLDGKQVVSSGFPIVGAPLSLAVSAQGTAPLIYTWHKDGVLVPQSDNSTFILQSVEKADTGSYYCVVRNLYSCDTSLEFSLLLDQHQAPVMEYDTVLSSGNAELDSTFTLYVNATGSPTLTYQWYKDDEALEEQTGGSLIFSALKLDDAGEYHCVVKNDFDEATSQTYSLAIAPRAHILIVKIGENGTITPKSQTDTVVIAEKEEFSCTLIPNEGYRLGDILKDGESVKASVSNSQYTLSDVNGDHTIEVSFEKKMYKVTISESGNGDVHIEPSIDDSVAHGTELTMGVTAEEGSYFSGWDGEASGSETPLTVTVTDDMEIRANFAEIGRYTVNVTINSDEGTYTIVPDISDYEEGTEVTVIAQPNSGYAFTGWDGDTTTVEDTIRVIIADIIDIAAQFEALQYTLEAHVLPGGSGTIETNIQIDSPLVYGTEVTLAPKPSAGYSFIGWGGDTTTAEDTIRISIFDDIIVTAQFEALQYTLNAQIFPNGSGTINGETKIDSLIDYGSEVTLTAEPADGYRFTGWSGDFADTSSSLLVTLTSDIALAAQFVPLEEFALLVSVDSGNGTVALTPDKNFYRDGDEVILVAQPAVGYTFQGWGGGFSETSDSIMITVDRDYAIAAAFDRLKYSVAVEADDEVTVSPSNTEDVLYGDDIEFIFATDPGYKIDSVVVNGESKILNQGNSITISSVDRDHTIRVFSSIQTYSLHTGINLDVISDTVKIVPARSSYTYGDTVEITAPTVLEYVFKGWGADVGGTEKSLEVVMRKNMNITAHYEMIIDTLSITRIPFQGGTVTPEAGTYERNSTVTLTATPAQGYRFAGWTGDVEGTLPEVAIFFDSNMDVVANFELDPPAIVEHPTDKSIYVGEEATLQVEANGIGLEYLWQRNGEDVISSNSSIITVSDSGEYRCIVSNAIGSVSSTSAIVEAKTTLTDIEGNEYSFVKIGDQLWTTSNLRVTSYNDGSEISRKHDSTEWINDSTGAYVFSTTGITFENEIERYGAYYNWYAVQKGLAPEGWRVPDTTDWNELVTYLMENGYSYPGVTEGDGLSASLAGSNCALSGWEQSLQEGAPGYDMASNNSSGFTACPSGYRVSYGSTDIINIDRVHVMWTSSEELYSSAYTILINNTFFSSEKLIYSKNCGASIRLVRDIQQQ